MINIIFNYIILIHVWRGSLQMMHLSIYVLICIDFQNRNTSMCIWTSFVFINLKQTSINMLWSKIAQCLKIDQCMKKCFLTFFFVFFNTSSWHGATLESNLHLWPPDEYKSSIYSTFQLLSEISVCLGVNGSTMLTR